MSHGAFTNGETSQIGQACPRSSCDGVLGVYATRVDEELQRRIRWLSCNKCGCRPENNVQILPLHYSPPRKRA
jgi:hypothetical protein